MRASGGSDEGELRASSVENDGDTALVRDDERLHRERAVFDRQLENDGRWVKLQVAVARIVLTLLAVIMALCAVVILRAGQFGGDVVVGASAVLFANVVALGVTAYRVLTPPARAGGALVPTSAVPASDAPSSARVSTALGSTPSAPDEPSRGREITVAGRLRTGDSDPETRQCKVDTHAGSIACELDGATRDVVLGLVGRLVVVSGVAEVQADGSTVLHVDELKPIESAESKSLDTLASEQGVGPLDTVSALRGEYVDDFDEFMEIVRSAR